MSVDKNYCMSSFLAVRYIADPNIEFAENMKHYKINCLSEDELISCYSPLEIDKTIKNILSKYDLSKAGLMLSGGMDSAILASYMPKGTKAYTARCKANKCIDETERAAYYCKQYGLEHVIVDIGWEDYLECMDALMLNDGSPIFANEPQVYNLVKRMVQDGVELIVYGDNADMAFGGMDKLLSRDWTYEEWKERYTFLKPSDALINWVDMDSIYEKYRIGDKGIDYVLFLKEVFASSSSGAYINAFRLAGLDYVDPYAYMKMNTPLDLARVRSGDSKYLIRELFKMKYPNCQVPEKIAMARAVDEWLYDWQGPTRDEFIPGCAANMTGEQKFLLYSLERFLNLIEG